MRSRLAALAVGHAIVAACNGAADTSGVRPDQPLTPDHCRFRTAADDAVSEPPRFTPKWAFEPWISKDISDANDTRAFVRGFRERDIPVGVVVLDSPWETHYNTYVPNPRRYPEFSKLLTDLHEDNVRLVLWITQMINSASIDLEEGGGDTYEGPSPNLALARECGFLADGGREYLWWKGVGAPLDLFHPEAVAFVRRQQDALLDLGIDGWKLDFGEEPIRTPTVATYAGEVTKQAFSEQYYREFLAYGVARRGKEFVTLSRPYDQSYGMPGRFFARREHAPVAWVGDNHRNWEGLSDALDHLLRSGAAGYAVIGSDVGGYLDRNEIDLGKPIPFDVEVFQRWTAMAAMMPFMQLHGRANLAPWTVPERTEETIELYRYWSHLHSELVPFFFSLATETYAGGAAVVRPIGAQETWAGDYRFMVGDAFLVAPLLAPGGRRDVELPPGEWYDWWQPDAPAIAGAITLPSYDATPRRRIPLFVKAGAIVPVEVRAAVTGLGDASSSGKLTVLVYPGSAPSSFALHGEGNTPVRIDARRQPDGGAEIALSRAPRPLVLRVRSEAAPASVQANGVAVTTFRFDAAARQLWIELPAGREPLRIEIAAASR